MDPRRPPTHPDAAGGQISPSDPVLRPRRPDDGTLRTRRDPGNNRRRRELANSLIFSPPWIARRSLDRQRAVCFSQAVDIEFVDAIDLRAPPGVSGSTFAGVCAARLEIEPRDDRGYRGFPFGAPPDQVSQMGHCP